MTIMSIVIIAITVIVLIGLLGSVKGIDHMAQPHGDSSLLDRDEYAVPPKRERREQEPWGA